VLKAAQAQLAAARNVAARDALRPAYVAQAQVPRSQPQPWAAPRRVLRKLRAVWILPSLVAATAAALLVFRNDQHTLAPDTPAALSPKEVEHAPLPSSAAEPAAASEANTASPDDSSSGVAAPRAEAPARPARQRRSPRGTKFATPPADWQRSPAAESEARAPTATHAAPTRDDRAPAVAPSEARARGASSALKTSEASDDSLTLGAAHERTAAPAAAAPSAPDSPTSSDALDSALPAPLTAARLDRRAREHAAATRWAQAAADYRELLRRFPQDPRRKLWNEQLELALRAASRPALNK
jgi:hypothetical protein